MLIFWLLLGALIGAYAAQRRGFSMLGGAVGGHQRRPGGKP